MNPQEKEKRIAEQRTGQAITRNLMGAEGKIGMVVRFLGEPLEYMGGSSVEGGIVHVSHNMDYCLNYWDETDNPEEMPSLTKEDMYYSKTNQLGMMFNGLSLGIHMEIKYLNESHELSLMYKGWLVYQEVAGELARYVPLKEWEDHVDRLYAVALTKAKKHKEEVKQENKQEGLRRMTDFLNKLRLKWGI